MTSVTLRPRAPGSSPSLQVGIDIKPENGTNPVNPRSRGVIPVGILGSDTFDVADVDVSTLAFGPNGAPLAHRNGPHVKDANHDGIDDLLGHFNTEGRHASRASCSTAPPSKAATPSERCHCGRA
jgi:hypothetical protein